MSKRKLIRSTGVIGAATALSRILGFVRDIVIAAFFGTAVYAQAFVVAFRIPNLLRDLIGEGATNAAFVPVLTEELEKKGKQDFFALSQVILNILFTALLVLAAVGMLASPLIVKLIAPGFSADPQKFGVTVTLTRVLFPFLILVGLWAYAMGVLNTLGHFAAPAFGSCALNLTMILCAMWFGENVFGLAAGVLAGGLLQLAMQFPPLYLNGWRPRLTSQFAHPKAKRIGRLLLPRALGACVYQVNVFVSTVLASFSGIVGEGAVAALYYANRIWQLPLAVFGIALAQAALPAMSKHAALDETEHLKETISFSLKAVFFMLVPATVGLMALATPITRVLFERGLFTDYSTRITASALFFYAFGLVACGGAKILVSAFYSMQDTMTPVKTAFWSLALNIALNVALMGTLKVGGLALATSVSAVFNFAILFVFLKKRIGDFGVTGIFDSLARALLAGIVMGAVLLFALPAPSGWTGLILTIAFGIAVYAAAAYLLKSEEMRSFLGWISGKR
jgi:putative peptidoglycan lipid II flippase